jgi:phage terminase large subunit-like protein
MNMMQSLGNDYDVILLKQTYTALSPVIKSFRDDVYQGNIIYKKNKLLDWCASNAVEVRAKVTEDILLAKENKTKQRIDLLLSSIFAYSQIYLQKDSKIPELTEEYINKWFGNLS